MSEQIPRTAVGEDFERLREASQLLNTAMDDPSVDPFQRVILDRMTRPEPRFDVGSDFYNRFIDLALDEERQHDDFFELGLDIGADILDSSKNDRDKILGLVNAYASMNYLLSAISLNSDIQETALHHRVSSFVTATVLDSMPDYEKNKKLMFQIHHVVDELEERAAIPDIARFFQVFSNALILAETYDVSRLIAIGESRINLVASYDNEKPIGHDTERSSTLLTKEAMEHRKYGTKPAYIEASTGGAWVFYDGEYYKEKMGIPSDVSSNLAAVVFHVADAKLKDLRIFQDDMGPDLGLLNHGIARVGGAAKNTNMSLFIMHNGNITTDQFGLNKLESTYSQFPLAAQRMKAEVASNFYDLSMPMYKDAPSPKNYGTMTDQEKELFDPIEQLLIPRIRYIDQQPEESNDVVRVVREHDVTWFVRPLPAGFHASPEAVASATKHGIKLEENETFVKAHKRGIKGQKALGYHAIKRY